MFKRLFALCILFSLLALSLTNADPSLAQGEEPPAADIMTLDRVSDIYAGLSGSSPEDLVVYSGSLYFGANGNDGAGREIWRYDFGAGVTRVTDIYPGPSGSLPYYLTVYDSALYFGAGGNDGVGRELWRYTPAFGAVRMADICSGATGSDPVYLEVYAGELYFAADGCDVAGSELWKYNSTSGIAERVADINSGAGSSTPYFLVVYNDVLYFSADGGDGAGRELWMYDPVNGAQRVEDILKGATSSYPSSLAVYNGALYFGADGGDGLGKELWRYDPVNGTQHVADINIGAAGSNPSHLTVYNGALYFSANGNDGAGRELWKYDAVHGADRVADIYPGSGSSAPAYPAVYNGALYFQANGNDGTGSELWMYGNSSVASFRSVKSLDGWALESGETTNAGGTINAASPVFYLGDNAQNRQYRAILSFDTSTLPDTAVITGVSLSIRRQGLAGTDPFSTHGNIRVDIRKGAFGNNNALQAGDFQAAASRNNVGTLTNTPSPSNWYSAKLLATAYAHINPSGVTQLRLRFVTDDNNDNGADYLKFFSGDSTTLSNRPWLTLIYYVP